MAGSQKQASKNAKKGGSKMGIISFVAVPLIPLIINDLAFGSELKFLGLVEPDKTQNGILEK